MDSYIAGSPKEIRGTLTELRRVIKGAAPKAIEKISYGMPFYEYGGKGIKGRLIYFAAFKKHISLFITPWESKTLPKEIKKYHVSKATYKFRLNEPFPYLLLEQTIRRLVQERERTLKIENVLK